MFHRARYWQRIFSAYVFGSSSHLSFWHGDPRINEQASLTTIGQYFMLFEEKANYTDHVDSSGIPLLNYRGSIGPQYNPIAISQYGLGNHDLFLRTNDSIRKDKLLVSADWLVENLTETKPGLHFWLHHFDWEYRIKLKAPWRSGLAQGQGISLLTRAYKLTGDDKYKTSAMAAFEAMKISTSDGGVGFVDESGDTWIEEYIVDPPTHILNGFIWAMWGIRDVALEFGTPDADELWKNGIDTIKKNLSEYDTGRWSLYELSGYERLPMLASSFYHRLHIVQLNILSEMTGDSFFSEVAERWLQYSESARNRIEAKLRKIAFKLLRY